MITAAWLALFCLVVASDPAPWGRRPVGLLSVCGPLFAAQVIYLGWSKRINGGWTAGLLLAWWIASQFAIRTWSAAFLAVNAVVVWHTIAFLVFGVLLLLDERLPLPGWIEGGAEMSYSVFLLHNQVGLAVLVPLSSRWPYPWALGMALVFVAAAAYLSARFVEVPSQNAARALLRRWGERRLV